MKFLSDEQVDRLEWICDDEGFIEYIEDYIGVLKAGIRMDESRSAKAEVQKELDRLKKAIDGLSTDASFHIHNQIALSKYPEHEHTWIDEDGVTHIKSTTALLRIEHALQQPYFKSNNMKPSRKSLMHFLRVLNNTYTIQPGDGERVAKIICKAAGMNCGSTIFRTALEYPDLK